MKPTQTHIQKLVVTVGVLSLRFPLRYRVYEQEDTLYVTQQEILEFRRGNNIWKTIIETDDQFKTEFIKNIVWVIDRELTMLDYTYDEFIERIFDNPTCKESINAWFRFIKHRWSTRGYTPKDLLQTQKIV